MTQKNDDVPMIEEYKVDTIMVHASKICRFAMVISICAMIAVVSFIIGIVRIVDIFTSKYNVRTKDWLDTLQSFSTRTSVTEVWDGNTEEVQQFPAP